jgi:hypothetical protein
MKAMTDGQVTRTMICPCCGVKRGLDAEICGACGARRVGEPLAPPDRLLPGFGPSFIALAIPLVVIIGFIAIWLLNNDLKAARALLVLTLGDEMILTRKLIEADPRLPFYRIFSYDAYRLAFWVAAGVIPLSLAGIWQARRALRLITGDAARFTGRNLARFSLALSLLLAVAFSLVTAKAIPEAIARGREKRLAATRAQMYQLHDQALQKYYREYGTYPQELSDLGRVNRAPLPQQDSWERGLRYSPVSVIAAKGGAAPFSNYRLVSAGPDGEFGNADDVLMIDGVIVSAPPEGDLTTDYPTLENPPR